MNPRGSQRPLPQAQPQSAMSVAGNFQTIATATPATQAEAAIQAIKDYILTSGLKPGDPLPTETQLCEQLQVSRSSVREAVRTLVALDIVEVRHGRGTFVGQASMRPVVESLVFRGLLGSSEGFQGLLEVVELRSTLDHALATEVVKAWKGHQDHEIEEVLDAMQERAERGEAFPEQDRTFHTLLLSRLDNQLYRHLADALWATHVLLIPLLRAPEAKDLKDTALSHQQIYRTAVAGDLEAHQIAVTSHYRPLLTSVKP